MSSKSENIDCTPPEIRQEAQNVYDTLLPEKSKGTIIYESLDCIGKTFSNVSLSAYYPQFEEETNLFLDAKGKKLRTLQDYLDNRTEYITLAMDSELNIPYGTEVCIPELNKHFGRRLKIQVRDNGSDLKKKGYTRADICVRTETDSYDECVNRLVTLVF